MNRALLDALLVGAVVAAIVSHGALASPHTSAVSSVSSRSEIYSDLPPILLPESVAPALPVERARPGQGAELVFAFTVDTLGRVELGTVETLATPDSATAQAARSNLSGVHYVPARLVLDLGRCVTFNGDRGHCGGVTPHVRKIRARVVLRISTFIRPE